MLTCEGSADSCKRQQSSYTASAPLFSTLLPADRLWKPDCVYTLRLNIYMSVCTTGRHSRIKILLMFFDQTVRDFMSSLANFMNHVEEANAEATTQTYHSAVRIRVAACAVMLRLFVFVYRLFVRLNLLASPSSLCRRTGCVISSHAVFMATETEARVQVRRAKVCYESRRTE